MQRSRRHWPGNRSIPITSRESSRTAARRCGTVSRAFLEGGRDDFGIVAQHEIREKEVYSWLTLRRGILPIEPPRAPLPDKVAVRTVRDRDRIDGKAPGALDVD